MKEEEGSIVGMRAQIEIGKKKKGEDMKKGEIEKGGKEAALGSTGEGESAPEDREEGDPAGGEEAVPGISKIQEPNQETRFTPAKGI